MSINKEIVTNFEDKEALLLKLIKNFDTQGTPFGNQDRNSLKLFEFEDLTLNVKSFRVPNLINKIAYRFFRKSKAQRSFEYAKKLQELGVGTPQPIAFYEFLSPTMFHKSYYVSEQLDCDLTYRDLSRNHEYPNHEMILRAFTRFTFLLHEKGVNFLDHSPGNTLIKLENDACKFYLVDLNRMEFKLMNFDDRMKNFKRLTPHKNIVEIMSDEYAKVSGDSKEKIFSMMWKYTQEFQEHYHRRRKLKKKLKFWKK